MSRAFRRSEVRLGLAIKLTKIMDLIKTIGIVITAIIGLIGIIGGILSLIEKYNKFKLQRTPLGDRATQGVIIHRKDDIEYTTIINLVSGDLFKFIRNFGKEELGAVILDVTQVGEYYKVTIKYPPGVADNLKKVKK